MTELSMNLINLLNHENLAILFTDPPMYVSSVYEHDTIELGLFGQFQCPIYEQITLMNPLL